MIQPTSATLFDNPASPPRTLSRDEVKTLIRNLRAATRKSLRHGCRQFAQVPGGGLLCVDVGLRQALESAMGGRR